MNEEEKSRAKKLAGEIIVEGINDILDQSESPVEGGAFKSIKKDGSISTLFMEGDLRSQITFQELESDQVVVGIFEDAPEVERLKAYNHNVGDTLPKRQFIAPPNRRFKKEIMEDVENALDDIREDAKLRRAEDATLVQTVLSSEDILDLLGE